MIRMAVIGCGGRGKGELKEMATFGDVEVVAVCDPLPEVLAQTADEFGVERRYESIEKMIDAGGIDVAFVTTPAQFNAPSALPCLEAGIHTLIEKPPGMRVEETIQLREAAERSGAKAMVGWQRRFNPFIVEARRQIEERGPIAQLVGEFHKSVAGFEQSGFPEVVMDRLLMETPIHAIDCIRSLAGSDVAEVHSVVKRRFSKYNDVHAALVLFENGCVAQISSNYTGDGRLERYEIHGQGISAYLEGIRGGYILADRESRELTAEGDAIHAKDEFFFDCVRNDRPVGPPGASLDEAVKTMELAEAILAGLRED
jgi:UDP-N-acetylglucosamine 3-dehydrogenase